MTVCRYTAKGKENLPSICLFRLLLTLTTWVSSNPRKFWFAGLTSTAISFKESLAEHYRQGEVTNLARGIEEDGQDNSYCTPIAMLPPLNSLRTSVLLSEEFCSLSRNLISCLPPTETLQENLKCKFDCIYLILILQSGSPLPSLCYLLHPLFMPKPASKHGHTDG